MESGGLFGQVYAQLSCPLHQRCSLDALLSFILWHRSFLLPFLAWSPLGMARFCLAPFLTLPIQHRSYHIMFLLVSISPYLLNSNCSIPSRKLRCRQHISARYLLLHIPARYLRQRRQWLVPRLQHQSVDRSAQIFREYRRVVWGAFSGVWNRVYLH